jgi:hypothetical protein
MQALEKLVKLQARQGPIKPDDVKQTLNVVRLLARVLPFLLVRRPVE